MAKKLEVNSSKREELLKLLKEGTPRIFEREPVAAFAQAELEKLADAILAL